MPRSKWKHPFISPKLFADVASLYLFTDKLFSIKQNKDSTGSELDDTSLLTIVRKHIKPTLSRNSEILSSMVGLSFDVHNGRKFIRVHIKEDMIGRKLGAFVPTRIMTVHKKAKKK